MGVEGIAPQTAWDMVHDVTLFERWAGDRLQGPQDITAPAARRLARHNKSIRELGAV